MYIEVTLDMFPRISKYIDMFKMLRRYRLKRVRQFNVRSGTNIMLFQIRVKIRLNSFPSVDPVKCKNKTARKCI